MTSISRYGISVAKGSDFGRFVRAGRAQGQRLRRGDALAATTSSTNFEDAQIQLAKAREHAARGTLVDREWVLMSVRGLRGLLLSVEPERAAPILEEADALAAEVLRQDEVEFAPLRDEIREGRYTVDRWQAEVASRPAIEQDAYTSRLLGLHNPPRPSHARETDMVHFVSSSVQDVLDIANIVGPDDVFYDVGCGTGKVALLTHWLTGATVKGVEFDSAYVDAANVAKTALGFDVEFIAADARALAYEDATVFYMYEPFRGEVMTAFLDRVKDLIDRRPLTLLSRFVVVDGLEGVSWLQLVESRPSGIRRYEPERG